jgi:hypothetical protein
LLLLGVAILRLLLQVAVPLHSSPLALLLHIIAPPLATPHLLLPCVAPCLLGCSTILLRHATAPHLLLPLAAPHSLLPYMATPSRCYSTSLVPPPRLLPPRGYSPLACCCSLLVFPWMVLPPPPPPNFFLSK